MGPGGSPSAITGGEVSDGAQLEADNPEVPLALTDARSIVGDATLLDRFLEATDVARTATPTLDALKTHSAHRHATINHTFYQLEPELKEAPGGLRDLFGAQTIAKLTDPKLLRQGGSGMRALDDAEEFLLRHGRYCIWRRKGYHGLLATSEEKAAERLSGSAHPAKRA